MWWREGEHWSSLTWARRRPWGVVVSEGARRSWGIVVMGGHRRCLLVGRHPRALEGCARGGAHRPSWFERGGGRSRGWGVVAARGRLSFMGPWLGHRCGGQGVAVRGGVVVHVRLWEVLVVALVARGRR